MSERCPSDLALEQHLLEPARSRAAAHVQTCARCQARLQLMERQGDEFRRVVLPATLDAVTEPRPPPWRRLLLIGAPVLAAAGVLVAVVTSQPPSDDYVGGKGAWLGLTLFAGGPEGAHEIADGAKVPATSSVRFRVRAGKPCQLWLLSVDDAGQVSRVYPQQGGQGAPVQGVQTPPGGAVLDGREGLERFFAVCAPGPLPYEEIERAAGEIARGGYKRLRDGGPLPGLPEGIGQASVLVEKKR